jgi:two-component system, LytTR family, sensor kinase
MKIQKLLSVFLPQNRFARHSLVWAVFILANSALNTIGQQENQLIEFIADYIMSLPIIFLITYLTAYWLIPKFLVGKKIILFSILFLGLFIVSGFLEQLKTQLLLLPLIRPEKLHVLSISFDSVFRGAFFILIPTVYFIAIKYSGDWYKMKVLKTEEERKQLKYELKYLKSQVHPHFLLVTLSNLETIAREDPVRAAPGIEKISEILNFILYECNYPQIRLNKELEHIKSFIELQEMNFSQKPEINYCLIGPSIKVRLAPLMLFTIVEFFFKKPPRNDESLMKLGIFLEVFHNSMNFSVESEYFEISQSDFDEDPGIINLVKRIGILYPKDGELIFRNNGNKSLISLNLKYA